MDDAQGKIKALESKNETLRRENGACEERIDRMAEGWSEAVALYADRIYGQARWFADYSVQMHKRRGLFILLVDRRRLNEENFSDFNENQEEYLDSEMYRPEKETPHIFSHNACEVLDWMGKKDIRFNENGDIVRCEERDGAILVDLRGVMFRTRQMIEGVRTHKADPSIDRLINGGARHNAAVYASSLPEVEAAVAVSEETNFVTVFKNGKFVELYDPHKKQIYEREEYFSGKHLGDPPEEEQEYA